MTEVHGYPQMPAMTEAELDEFLAEPHLARLSTIDPDGTPHTLPIWYEWRDGEVRVSTQSVQRKVKNVERDPRVTILIDSASMPYRGVMISGEATVDPTDAAERRVSIFERYIGDHDAAAAYAAGMADKWDPVLIRIRPTRIISFDYSKASFVPES
ncbi:MAG: PPOX class F420-dependent oxidoreductase [Ilumatobacteraceae bacterium]|nr:PPOX class F420-dependent oxidoreductase [Ilumatobacteraceae bacterium]